MLPTVAEVLALDPLRRGAPRVVAAADGLDAPVRWVHVIELAEAAHLLRGGELVLATGIALPDDPSGLTRYVADLASVGVSALAVELGSRYARSLPAALVSAASRHRLPLIVLERETQFIEVTEAVHALIIDAQLEELRASERLHQVFDNLLSNAIKFTARNHASGQQRYGLVRITATHDDRAWRVEVTDSGIGIPPDDLGHVFDRFARASNAKAASLPGTGLGLSVVKAVAELHGGRVEVDSTEGHSTTFRVYLPMPR